MIRKKTRVVVLFGGRSPEHDVSVITGLQTLEALDPAFFDALPVYIAPDGQWLTGGSLRQRSLYIPGPNERKELVPVALHIGPGNRPHLIRQPRFPWQRAKEIPFDVALPAFHGLIGEDGNIQGLL